MTPEQQKAALESELQQVAKNYEEARNVMQNCERKIFELRGGINACEKLISPETKPTPEVKTEPTNEAKKNN